jgi:tetratricopeptide (TPR) repeat protein
MALSEIEKLERRYAENPQGLTFAPLAEVHRKNGDLTRALELLKPGLTLHPDYIPASIVLGRCHLDLGDLPAAETAFTHVLALDGENVIALKALADITERQGRFDEAERWLRTLLAIDRSNDEARDQLGRVEATRRQTATSAVVTEEAAMPAEATTTAESDRPAEGSEAAVAEADAGFSAADESPPVVTSPASPEPSPEHAMGWAMEPSTSEAAEVAPLDLEEFGTGLDVESSPLEGIQLEQPTELGDSVQPLAGLVGRDDQVDLGSFDHVADFKVETEEDIVLNSTGGSEFQVANAAEELLARREVDAPPSFPGASDQEALAGPGEEQRAGGTGLGDDLLAPIAMEVPEPTVSDVTGGEPPWSAPSGTASTETATADTAPTDTTATQAGYPEAAPYEAAAIDDDAGEHVPEATPEPWLASVSEPPRHAEPDLVVTASMAELLLQQGHLVEALTVYRLLETRAGGQSSYQEKIAELERLTAPAVAPAPAPQAPAPELSEPAPSYSVLQTGGQSAQAFLRTLLAARPATVSAGPAVQTNAPRPATASAEGAPTRPAHDSLSLSSVFGEESAPTQPAVPAAGGGAPASGVSYDEFFGGSGPATPRQQRASDPKSDDLDQFHAWLQNLKR